ncbi:MAG: hypothetical protein EXR17_03900 [Flavobacteriaceae bacterium]|nr:hypothetical protein [Flavobacteriaceae bacterium]
MDTPIQKPFIALLKNVTPPHLSLAEPLRKLLETSVDSVYRRLRCETEPTLSETLSICKHFDLTIEALSAVHSEIVAFRTKKLSSDSDSFGHSLQVLHNDLSWIMKYPNDHLIYAWLNNMLSKSTTLSVVAKKSPNQFFQRLHKGVAIFRHQVLTD